MTPPSAALSLSLHFKLLYSYTHTHTHTRVHIYIYIYSILHFFSSSSSRPNRRERGSAATPLGPCDKKRRRHPCIIILLFFVCFFLSFFLCAVVGSAPLSFDTKKIDNTFGKSASFITAHRCSPNTHAHTQIRARAHTQSCRSFLLVFLVGCGFFCDYSSIPRALGTAA